MADATRSVDQKSSARGSVLTDLTLSALGFPGHAPEEGLVKTSGNLLVTRGFTASDDVIANVSGLPANW
jgi:hypothetical protein